MYMIIVLCVFDNIIKCSLLREWSHAKIKKNKLRRPKIDLSVILLLIVFI